MRKPKVGDLVLIRGGLTYSDPPLEKLAGKVVRVLNIFERGVDVCDKSSFLVPPTNYSIVNFRDYYEKVQILSKTH